MIETIDLTKVYPGGVTAVDGMNLTVAQGEIFGLLGPNGAGKTTTASMLTTRVIPTSGRALVGGIDVVRQPAIAKQLIGVLPQTNTLDRSLTVWENLYFHGRFFGMGAKASRAAADELLVKFRLTERAKAPVMALSGGLAQRLMVARALLHNPAILFLDEPTAGLDPQSRIGLWEIVGALHETGQTVVLTTHNMEEADQLCDRIGIMDRGTHPLAGHAGGAEAVGRCGHDRHRLQRRRTSSGWRRACATVLRASTARPCATGRCRWRCAEPTGVLVRVIGAAEEAGYIVSDVQVAPPSLETVFIGLTGKDLRD